MDAVPSDEQKRPVNSQLPLMFVTLASNSFQPLFNLTFAENVPILHGPCR